MRKAGFSVRQHPAGNSYRRIPKAGIPVPLELGTSYLLAMNRIADAGIEFRRFAEFMPTLPGIGLAQFFYFTRAIR
jgi:hypothetical protein